MAAKVVLDMIEVVEWCVDVKIAQEGKHEANVTGPRLHLRIICFFCIYTTLYLILYYTILPFYTLYNILNLNTAILCLYYYHYYVSECGPCGRDGFTTSFLGPFSLISLQFRLSSFSTLAEAAGAVLISFSTCCTHLLRICNPLYPLAT